MAFKITAEEKQLVLSMRKVEAQDDERYASLVGDLRSSINFVGDSLRDLEDYMIAKPQLKSSLEKDFDKVEKFVFDSKNLIKKMEHLKVIIDEGEDLEDEEELDEMGEDVVSYATKDESLKAAHESCLEMLAVFDQADDDVIMGMKADLESHLIDYNDDALREMFDKADVFLGEAKKQFAKLESAIQSRL